MSRAVASISACERASSASSQPPSASAHAAAWPRPRPAPVTTATFPSSDRFSRRRLQLGSVTPAVEPGQDFDRYSAVTPLTLFVDAVLALDLVHHLGVLELPALGAFLEVLDAPPDLLIELLVDRHVF